MAYPPSHQPGHLSTPGHSSASVSSGHSPSFPSAISPAGARSRHPGGSADGDHQLEKLEFALAVALTRGDVQRSQQLREAIEALGGNEEEPGT